MKYSSHIGVVLEEIVRMYHDVGYIFVIYVYLQHKILESLQWRVKPSDAFAAPYQCLQMSTTYW